MSSDIAELTRRTAEFELRNSPLGMLKEYARGRMRFYWTRKVLSFIMIGLIAYYNTLLTTATIAVIAMLSDALDSTALRALRIGRLNSTPLKYVVALTTATAVFQGAVVAVGVFVLVHSTPGHDATPLALAYLMTASVYAGMFWAYHRQATVAHLLIFFGTACFIVFDGALRHEVNRNLVADLSALLVMAFVSFMFIRFFNETFQAQRRSRWALLRNGQELAQANADLVAQQRENHRLAQVAKHASDSIIICDASGRIEWVNDAFTRLNGYRSDEVLGKKPSELLNAPETSAETNAALEDLTANPRPFRTQILNRTKDGRDIWVGVNRVPILGADGAVESTISIGRDISEFKHNETVLARAKDAAEDAARTKARFLAAMSHEIRTPMSAIIGLAELLSEHDLPAEDRKMLRTMRRSGEALLTIINDVLDFSKLDAGKVELFAVPFDPRAVVDDVVTLLGPDARGKGLELKTSAEQSVPEFVACDDGRLRQILFNIIGNAIKFTEKGRVEITILGPAVRDPGKQGVRDKFNLAIRVDDTGIGIPADRLEHVFDEFAQADNATTREFGGTGLGLPISRLLARAMGGDISLSSTVGEGSSFLITVEVEPVANTVQGTSQPEPDTSLLDGKHILVADDNATNRMILRRFLSDLPVTLGFAQNGQEAIDAIAREAPDFVLMDMSMPVMDGLSATRLVRARAGGPQPRIVALTANAFASDKAACFEAGMDGFLAKPLRKSDLLTLLAELARPDGQNARHVRRA